MTFNDCSYKSRGRYKEQLERRLEYFPAGIFMESADYGIYQYLYLAREAVKHKPEYVILGLYPGNDIQPHACNSVNFAYYEKAFLKTGIASSSEKCGGREKRKTKPNFVFTRYSGLLSALEYLRTKYIRPKTAHIFSRKKYFNFGGGEIYFQIDQDEATPVN